MVSPLFRFLRSPATNGGVAPSRPLARGASSREAELERELAALRSQQAALVRQERAAAANLDRMRDSLDVLAGEIDKRARAARDPDLRARGERMITDVKAYLARQDGCDIRPATVATAIKIALGLEASPHRFAAPRPGAVVPIDPDKTAAAIVAAGRKARGETPPEMPSDPTAAGIVAAGKRARNEPDE